jgi:hypothetical protein
MNPPAPSLEDLESDLWEAADQLLSGEVAV